MDTGSYRIPIGVQFAYSIIIVGGMLLLPETPRYCIKKGKYEEAARSLSKLRRLDISNPHLQDELAEIRANHEYEMNIGSASYIGLFKRPLRKRIFTGILLQALQQLT
jgi:MFS transporter, SP family, sugar:H+ symporter